MSRAAYNFNRRVEAFIEEKQRMQVPFSKSDLAYLNRYTGYGGLAKFGAEGKGLLSEYFTPVELVEKMMGLAYQHGYVDGPVLEPSCGIGRFLHYLPKETEVDAFEINPTSWQIAKANFPDYHIFNQYFNELFVTRTGAAKQSKQTSSFSPKSKTLLHVKTTYTPATHPTSNDHATVRNASCYLHPS